MAIAAMANVTHIERREMLALQQKFRDVASRDGNPNMINRQAFTESLTIVGVNQNDADILDRLFTMYDKTGDDIIVYKDFLAGIAPLISGSHNDKIEFSFRMLDLDGTGNLMFVFFYSSLSTHWMRTLILPL